jgi:hypothetical protein
VAVAEQLRRCGLRLRDEDTRRWERELRALNVTRAALTTQLVAARAQAVALCDALGIADAAALAEVQGKAAAADGASAPALQEQADGAALSLVLANSASNPPGSEPLLQAVRRLVRDLEGARDARARVEAPAKQLAALFHAATAAARSEGAAAPPAAADGPLHSTLTYLRAMPAAAADARDALAARLGALLEHVIATAGGAAVAADAATEAHGKVAALVSTAAAAPADPALVDMEASVAALASAAAGSREGWLREAAREVEVGWKAVKESQIPKSKPSNAEPTTSAAAAAAATAGNKVFAKEALRQLAALGAELARLTAVADTFRDLQRLDTQLVRHVREMEDFEAASKQDRMKLLSGNSKALVEEEKFRKAGKRKYEQVTERIIVLAEQLESLTATAGSGDAVAVAAALDIGPLDLSCLSAQSHTVLKGKVHWQEKLELMHLHTTTHGTRRWSGGLPTPPGPAAAAPPPAPAHVAPAAAAVVPPAAPAGPAAAAKEKDDKAPGTTASGARAAAVAVTKARPQTASTSAAAAAAALNPFAAATNVAPSSSTAMTVTAPAAAAPAAAAPAVAAANAMATLGPAVRPKDAVLHSNTAHNSKAAPVAATGVTKKAATTTATAAAKKAVSFSTKENADANL